MGSEIRNAPTSGPIDIGALLDEASWSGYLKFLVFLAALAIVFDGIDNQLLAVAIPSMMKEWNLPRGAFTNVLAAGLFGMMVGGATAGIMGDRLGRKFALLFSVFFFGILSIAMASAQGVVSLLILRFLAGVGLGGAIPNAAALVSEYVPRRHRPFAVTLTIVCVPLGGMLAGYLAGKILPTLGWRTLFVIGGSIPLLALLAHLKLLEESPRFLARHPARWPQLERFLQRAGSAVPHGTVFVDSKEESSGRSANFRSLFRAEFRRDTVTLWIAFLCCMLAFYAPASWLPSMLRAAGWSDKPASDGIFYFNLGGVLGAIGAAILFARVGSKPVMVCLAAGAVVASLVTAKMTIDANSVNPVLLMLGVDGCLINGLMIMTYALAAHIYPTPIRATGVGSAVAFGRVSGVLSPVIGSKMLELGGHASFFVMIAGAMLVCLASVGWIQRHVRRDSLIAAGR